MHISDQFTEISFVLEVREKVKPYNAVYFSGKELFRSFGSIL